MGGRNKSRTRGQRRSVNVLVALAIMFLAVAPRGANAGILDYMFGQSAEEAPQAVQAEPASPVTKSAAPEQVGEDTATPVPSRAEEGTPRASDTETEALKPEPSQALSVVEVPAVPPQDLVEDLEEDRAKPALQKTVDFSSDVPIFEPTHEWKQVLPGQPIPGGLDIRMNLQTGEKFARLQESKHPEEVKKDAARKAAKASVKVADHVNLPENMTNDDVEALPSMDAEMRSVEMMDRVLSALPEPPAELAQAKKEMDPERYKRAMQTLWKKRQKELAEAREALHDSGGEMQKATIRLMNVSSIPENLVITLVAMEQEVSQIDNAMDFTVMGGLAATINLLDHPNLKVRLHAAHVVGTCVKNYPTLQKAARDLGAIDTFLHVIRSESKLLEMTTDPDSSVDVVKKQMYGLGSLVRGSLDAELYLFKQKAGLVLHNLLETMITSLVRGPSNAVQGPTAPDGSRPWTPETLILKRKLCGVQSKVLSFVNDLLVDAVGATDVLGGLVHENGQSGIPIAQELTSPTWCSLFTNLIALTPCDDDVSREKILRTTNTMLKISERTSEEPGKMSECSSIVDKAHDLKTSLSIWRREWEDVLAEDPDDTYAQELIELAATVVKGHYIGATNSSSEEKVLS